MANPEISPDVLGDDISESEQPIPDELILNHAPSGWAEDEDISRRIKGHKQISAIVMAADIRRSTFLMKEAVSERTYGDILGDFIESSKRGINERGGWFDKFTGDGFLAYWPYSPDSSDGLFATGIKVLRLAESLLQMFNFQVIPQLRANSRNFPRSAGLSIGIDAGHVRLLTIAGDLTIVSPTVVGAVRMVSAAAPSEVLLNVYLGEFLNRNEFKLESNSGWCVTLEYRQTKEYDQQEVYSARLGSLDSPQKLHGGPIPTANGARTLP